MYVADEPALIDDLADEAFLVGADDLAAWIRVRASMEALLRTRFATPKWEYAAKLSERYLRVGRRRTNTDGEFTDVARVCVPQRAVRGGGGRASWLV